MQLVSQGLLGPSHTRGEPVLLPEKGDAERECIYRYSLSRVKGAKEDWHFSIAADTHDKEAESEPAETAERSNRMYKV
jgi:hypothetical protein